MSTKPRKPTSLGSHVQASVSTNFAQSSPRNEFMSYKKGPFPLTTHQPSKASFISGVVLPEGPRAVTVNQNGEKTSLLLDEEILGTKPTPSFVVPEEPQPPAEAPTRARSLTRLPIMYNDRARMSSSRRRARRYNSQKPRNVFTVFNNMTRSLSESREPLGRTYSQEPNEMYGGALAALDQKDQLEAPQKCSCRQTPPAEAALDKTCENKETNAVDVKTATNKELCELPPRALVVRRRSYTDNFFEIRTFTAVLTMATFVCWLLVIVFEVDGFSNLLGNIIAGLHDWYLKRNPPKTKLQMIIAYLRYWWKSNTN